MLLVCDIWRISRIEIIVLWPSDRFCCDQTLRMQHGWYHDEVIIVWGTGVKDQGRIEVNYPSWPYVPTFLLSVVEEVKQCWKYKYLVHSCIIFPFKLTPKVKTQAFIKLSEVKVSLVHHVAAELTWLHVYSSAPHQKITIQVYANLANSNKKK